MFPLKVTAKESTKKKRMMLSSTNKRQKKKIVNPAAETKQLKKEIDSAQTIEIMKKMNKLHIKNQISKFYHTNFAGYPSKNQVSKKEQWEHKVETEKIDKTDLVTYHNNFELLHSLNTTITYTLTIWLANVQFFFGFNRKSFLSSNVYILPLIAVIFDFILTGELKKLISNCQPKKRLAKIMKLGLCVIYLCLKISEVQISRQPQWLLIQVPCIFIFYTRASQLYKSFRVMSLSKSYEYHFKAFDLIFSLVIVAHVIVLFHLFQAIILFLVASNVRQETTWMTSLQITFQNALVKYIYAFYFACTTILTVGYGDISPQNHVQVLVVCFIEIFGVAIFGYLLSEIGYNLSILRKDREILEKDLAVLDKCRQYYNIEPDLIIKARSKLLNSQESSDRLKPEEEKELMMKFNEPLRQDLITSNALSVLKSSVFFICRWSKHFQNSLAQSLSSSLYTPGEEFLQTPGMEKIYIIRLGKVDFYRKRKGGNQESRKVIQSLKVQLNTQVSNNSFGYTAVIGTKPTGLEVISRDFTSAYYVGRELFESLSRQNSEDFEYYSEIKDKIEQSRFPESLEVPVLSSRKYHYNPSRIYLIKRPQKESQLLENVRSDYERRERRKATKVKAIQLIDITEERMTEIRKMIITSYDEISYKSLKSMKDAKSIKSLKSLKQESLRSIDNQMSDIDKHPRQTEEKLFSVQEKLLKIHSTKRGQVIDVNTLDTAKQYSNFYPIQNCENILAKLDRYNFSNSKKEYQEESMGMRPVVFQYD